MKRTKQCVLHLLLSVQFLSFWFLPAYAFQLPDSLHTKPTYDDKGTEFLNQDECAKAFNIYSEVHSDSVLCKPANGYSYGNKRLKFQLHIDRILADSTYYSFSVINTANESIYTLEEFYVDRGYDPKDTVGFFEYGFMNPPGLEEITDLYSIQPGDTFTYSFSAPDYLSSFIFEFHFIESESMIKCYRLRHDFTYIGVTKEKNVRRIGIGAYCWHGTKSELYIEDVPTGYKNKDMDSWLYYTHRQPKP